MGDRGTPAHEDPLLAAGVVGALSGRDVVISFPSRAAAEEAYERAAELFAPSPTMEELARERVSACCAAAVAVEDGEPAHRSPRVRRPVAVCVWFVCTACGEPCDMLKPELESQDHGDGSHPDGR